MQKTLLPMAVVGTIATIVMVQPQVAISLSATEISRIAQQIAVRIDGQGIGSGVMIRRKGNTYTVLTNWHVVDEPGKYRLQTSDSRQYAFNEQHVQQIPGLDLAVVQFASTQEHHTASVGNSDQLKEGQIVYVAGYPGSRADPERNYRFHNFSIVSILNTPIAQGYALGYQGDTIAGMSGSPLLDENGLLVGIHGLYRLEDTRFQKGLSYAIPIQAYLEQVERVGEPQFRPPEAGQPALISTVTGVDYTHLRDLLAAQQWQEADLETTRAMLSATSRSSQGWLSKEDIDTFPCGDLQAIDRLWVQYSQGRFGFSVQKFVWQSIGGGADYETFVRLGERLGWQTGSGEWREYQELTFSLDAPVGHLPVSGFADLVFYFLANSTCVGTVESN